MSTAKQSWNQWECREWAYDTEDYWKVYDDRLKVEQSQAEVESFCCVDQGFCPRVWYKILFAVGIPVVPTLLLAVIIVLVYLILSKRKGQQRGGGGGAGRTNTRRSYFSLPVTGGTGGTGTKGTGTGTGSPGTGTGTS